MNRSLLKLQLKNMGSGRLASTVTVNTDGGGTREVIGIQGSDVTVAGLGDQSGLSPVANECPFAGGSLSGALRFVGDESSPYYCTIDLAGLKDKVTTETSRLISTNIKYKYELTKSAVIVVNPKIVE